MTPASGLSGNRLLDLLPRNERRPVLDRCETVELAFGEVLFGPRERLKHAHFPTSAFISLVMPVDPVAVLEVGLVGSEGMVGIPLALGVDESLLRAVVQGEGSVLRMEARAFREELGKVPALRQAIDRYVAVRLNQLAQTAVCTRFHVVEARLARWLLMTQDRAHSNEFRMTQEYLAFMLGVRRVGVTRAASSLQERGLIRYRRGNISVVDRRGLRAASCGCYRADLASYERLLG